jgi:hypothetical protein
MSSVRARWGLDDLAVDGSDPFLGLEPSQPDDPEPIDVRDVGMPIDLTGDVATLKADLDQRLIALMREETQLYERGVTCDIRHRPQTTCLACPVASEDGPMGRLCSNGRESDRVSTAMVALRHVGPPR